MAEINNERYEELRGYLEVWLERSVIFEETKEIGDGFIDFYGLLWQLTVKTAGQLGFMRSNELDTIISHRT